MNPFATIFALGQAIGFKFQILTERRVQEYGVSPLRSFALYRYALIPALVWSVIFIRPGDLAKIIHTPLLVGYFLAIAVLWNLQAFLSSYLLNTISSMSAISTLQYLLYLPLLLIVGTFFNHDRPNVYSILAIFSLLLAFIIQPAQHEQNIRTRFSLPVMAIVGLALLKASLDAANNGVSRQLLSQVSPQVFLGVFSVIAIGLCVLWTLFVARSAQDAGIVRQHRWLATAIPLLWFAASIPETYGFAALPIYTVVSIGAITFALDAVSDIRRHRIRFNFRTAGFIVLAVLGMGLAIFSA